jgi:nucleotide-binding universal stress UspA family protein
MKLLLAIDGSPASQKAIDEIAERPWPKSSALRIITVVTPYVPAAAEFVPGAATVPGVMQEHEAVARGVATQAAERMRGTGMPIEAVVKHGDPARVIVEESAAWEADLIVVGSHGRRGLERLVLGSVARAVMTHAPCSVEVVRERRNPSASTSANEHP